MTARIARSVLASVCLLGVFASSTAHAFGGQGQGPAAQEQVELQTIDALLGAFAKMPGLYAEFREEKHMSLLAQPLVNEGTLHFADGKLARHTVRPSKSSLVVAAGRLSFGDATGSDHIDLARSPVVKLFVDSFVKILAGDRKALDRMYSMQLTQDPGPAPRAGGARGWSLTLRPKLEPMKGAIDRLVLEGVGIDLIQMRVVERGGDETVTAFANVDTQHRYTKAEAAKTFIVR